MDLDIQTEHVAMQPEWRRTIADWLARSTKQHPRLAAVDLRLRRQHGGHRVDTVARLGSRSVRAGAQAESMTTALHDALDAL